MKPTLMVSYSRQQIPFVDAFYKDLVKAGYDVWLDYQRLVPSEPWFDQVTAGVKNSDIILLVVSKDSMISKNVENEWTMAFKEGKRVILVLFEAAPLMSEQLKQCEYVDFRTNYRAGLKRLKALLNGEPQPNEHRAPIPESGFKASAIFWVTFVVSVLLAVGSLSAIWTFFIPFILMPLPVRIIRRDYNFSQVGPTLILTPFFYIVSEAILKSEGNIFSLLPQFVFTLGVIAALLAWVLLVLLLTPAMRLRARPEAVPARVVNRTRMVEEAELRSVKFFIDHAPEDGRYAEKLRHVLEKHRHEYVEGDKNPQAVFVLLSIHKNKTVYKAGNGLSLFPIVLQKPGNIDGELGKIQWLDFRRGMRNLDKIATLLPEPEKLVRVLAVPPSGRQEVFPLIINALQFFYLITGVLGGGGLLITILSLTRLQFLGQLQSNIFYNTLAGGINGLLLFGAVFYCVNTLRTRSGGMAAVYPLLVLTVFQAVLHTFNAFILGFSFEAETGSRLSNLIIDAANVNLFAIIAFIIGSVIMLPFVVINWIDIYRWLPANNSSTLTRLEKALLLFTPATRSKFIFHILFHASVLFLFLVEWLVTIESFNQMERSFMLFCVGVPVTLFAFLFHWMAMRTPKKTD